MATTKKRLNITLSPASEILVSKLAARDKVPAATKVRELLEISLELVEDKVLTQMAEERLTGKGGKKTLSHDTLWGV
jgi:predicted DNA-binding protein